MLAIVRDLSEPICHQIELDLAKEKVCNLYIVPEVVMRQDVEQLSYGGYYAHKLVLSFREVAKSGTIIDPTRLFWTYECSRASSNIGDRPMPEILVRWVHSQIFTYRPTFLRPLANFVRSKARVDSLILWLAETPYWEGYASALDSVIQTAHNFNSQRAFWLFWREYEKHKSSQQGWSHTTISKMYLSLKPDDIYCVKAYLSGSN